MTALADFSIPTKVLSIDHTFFSIDQLITFFSSFFSFIIDNCNYGTLLRKCLKMKTSLLFKIVFTFYINVVNTILPRQ